MNLQLEMEAIRNKALEQELTPEELLDFNSIIDSIRSNARVGNRQTMCQHMNGKIKQKLEKEGFGVGESDNWSSPYLIKW